MVLTGVTVAVAYVNLRQLNKVIALGIASFKATLVVLYFIAREVRQSAHEAVRGDRHLLPVHPPQLDDDRLRVARVDQPAGAPPVTSRGGIEPGDPRRFTRLTIRGRSHTLPLHVTSEAEDGRFQAPGWRDCQPVAATQVCAWSTLPGAAARRPAAAPTSTSTRTGSSRARAPTENAGSS